MVISMHELQIHRIVGKISVCVQSLNISVEIEDISANSQCQTKTLCRTCFYANSDDDTWSNNQMMWFFADVLFFDFRWIEMWPGNPKQWPSIWHCWKILGVFSVRVFWSKWVAKRSWSSDFNRPKNSWGGPPPCDRELFGKPISELPRWILLGKKLSRRKKSVLFSRIFFGGFYL